LNWLVLGAFFAIELSIAGWSVRQWMRGWRIATEDRIAIRELALRGLSRSLGALERPEGDGVEVPIPKRCPSTLPPWLVEDPRGSRIATMSAIEAGELYDRERIGILEELARLANVLLLTGVCGTLSAIFVVLQTVDMESALGDAAQAFLVTLVAVVLCGVSILAQQYLARLFDNNATGLVAAWARIGTEEPVELIEEQPEAVGEGKLSSSGTTERSGALLDQQKALRELLEAIPKQIESLARTSDPGKLTTRYKKAIDGLSASVEAVDENVKKIVDEAALLRKVVLDFESASKAAAEAGKALNQLSTEAATSRDAYRDALVDIRKDFVESMRQTSNHLATLDRNIEKMAAELGGLVDQAMKRVDTALATQVTRYFDQLNVVQERFFSDLARIEEMAPEVGKALREIEPAARSTVVAVEEARMGAVNALALSSEQVKGVGQEVSSVLRTTESAIRSVESAVRDVHGAAERHLRSMEAASTKTMQTARWALLASASAAIAWLSLIGGWLLWTGRL